MIRHILLLAGLATIGLGGGLALGGCASTGNPSPLLRYQNPYSADYYEYYGGNDPDRLPCLRERDNVNPDRNCGTCGELK